MMEIEDPFVDEVRRHIGQSETEEIIHLGREDRDCNTGSETDDNGVGHELNHRPETRKTHEDKQYTRHHGSDHQTGQTVLLDDTVDDNDEGACGTTDLHLTSTEHGDDQTGYDGCDQTFRRAYSGGYTEGDSEGYGNDADNDSGQGILTELCTRVVAQCMK